MLEFMLGKIMVFLFMLFIILGHFLFKMSYKQVVQVICFFFVTILLILTFKLIGVSDFKIQQTIMYIYLIFFLVCILLLNITYYQVVQIFLYIFISGIIVGLEKGFSEMVNTICFISIGTVLILLLGYIFCLKKNGMPFKKSFHDFINKN